MVKRTRKKTSRRKTSRRKKIQRKPPSTMAEYLLDNKENVLDVFWDAEEEYMYGGTYKPETKNEKKKAAYLARVGLIRKVGDNEYKLTSYGRRVGFAMRRLMYD